VTGLDGDTGVTGIGSVGNTGVTGLSGIGSTGVTGSGDTGVTGLQGVTGSLGVTAVPSSDHTASGLTLVLITDVTVNFGDVCKVAATGNTVMGDADAIADSSAIVMCVDETIAASGSGDFLILGIARNDTWSWTAGQLIYLSTVGTTGNTMTQTAPSGANDVIQILGVATNTDRMYFNPQLVQVEHV
jgi:hypothetical protein